MKEKTLIQLYGLINQWAIDRGLNKADSSKQVLKLMEEVGNWQRV